MLGLTTAYEMPNIFFLLSVLRLAIAEVTKGKKGRILYKKYQVKLKIQNLPIFSY